MKFSVLHKDKESRARKGKLETDHGTVDTPVFMPVGTLATVRGVLHRDLTEDIKAQIILGNTYHLYLRPGVDIIREAGGFHKFCSWDKPVLTDSGGYQVFSLASKKKVDRGGIFFPIAYRWLQAFLFSGESGRYTTSYRGRYHHGVG